MLPFSQSFFDFYEVNLQIRKHRLSILHAGWHKALDSLVSFYHQNGARRVLVEALSDPYFPLSKLRRLNFEEFASESRMSDFSQKYLQMIVADHLLKWAEIFLSIKEDLRGLENRMRLSPMSLIRSADDPLPTGGWCTYCGSCCEIRGGPPEFTGPIEVPKRWVVYFRGDGCSYQRFCPFFVRIFLLWEVFLFYLSNQT